MLAVVDTLAGCLRCRLGGPTAFVINNTAPTITEFTSPGPATTSWVTPKHGAAKTATAGCST